jgi:hypothetical protein
MNEYRDDDAIEHDIRLQERQIRARFALAALQVLLDHAETEWDRRQAEYEIEPIAERAWIIATAMMDAEPLPRVR